MQPSRCALLVVLLAACDGALPITVHEALNPATFGSQDPMDDLPKEVTAACTLLGLACVVEPDVSAPALVLLVTPGLAAGVEDGVTLVRTECTRVAWSTLDRSRVAHQIGLLLGLPYSHDPGNVMHKMGRVYLATTEQAQLAQHAAGELLDCRSP